MRRFALGNERGFLTVDFIFTVVLIFGMMAILFVFSLTLTVASLTQYITFATARNYQAGHLDQAHQEQLAQAKYKQLIKNKTFAPFFKNGWFELSKQPDVGDISQVIQGYQSGGPNDPNLFWGAGTHFTAMILDFKIPGFGSTAPGDQTGKGFNTYMGSYLGREVTQDECMKFENARWTAIQNLPSTNGGAAYTTAPNAPSVYTDDGC